jgi:thiol-disulfide isomerase/thioredoxin
MRSTMTSMPLRRAVLAVALTAWIAGACAGGDAVGWTHAAIPAQNATTAALLPTDAAELPDVDAATFDRLLAQLRGTPVVVNVWGSWCGPCRQEAPLLADAADRYGSRVQFLGIDILDSRASARAFMQQFGWRYPSLYDATAAVRDHLGLLGQPDTLFYDASGSLAFRWPGPLTASVLDRRIRALLGTS